MPIGPLELIIILAIALLFFGPKKLPEMGQAIGKSITSFKKGLKDKDKEEKNEDQNEQKQLEQKRIELEALERELATKKAALHTQEGTNLDQSK